MHGGQVIEESDLVEPYVVGVADVVVVGGALLYML